MERIVLLGCSGAGKSTLAEKLSERTGLPAVHLDTVFWREGWTPVPANLAQHEFSCHVAKERWILDGNFLDGQSGDERARFERANAVIFLDVPRRTCLWRVFKRLIRDRRRTRADLPVGCSEGVDLSLLRWIWRYPVEDRPKVLKLLATLPPHVQVRHLRSSRQVREFLKSA